MSDPDIKEVVKEKYGEAALRVKSGGSSCCGASASSGCADPITSNLYEALQANEVPEEALLASLGCGNPTALAKLNPGEVVLDLGSGGGIDVLLSARRVGPTGKAYGLDMTDEMLALANENKRKAGAENVEFLRGEIEHIPLPNNSVDVIISNCVINLSADKDQVLREAFRVLKPGGRYAFQEMASGEAATSYFPLPWATEPSDSFLVSAEEMGSVLGECGFVAELFEDTSDTHLSRTIANATPSAQGQLGLSVFVDNLAQKAKNARRSLEENQVRLVRGIFRVSSAQ